MGLLHRKFFDLFPQSFGLDLSDLSIKALWLEREGREEVVSSYGSIPLPLGTIVDGEILKEDIVVDAIKKLVHETRPRPITTRKVIGSLPETKAFLRIISLPKMDEEEAIEAVKWEIEANIPLPLDMVYYDAQVLGPTLSKEKGKMNVLVVAVARVMVDQFHSVLEKSGLEVVGLETESIAQARSLLPETAEKTSLIVDIGDRRTSFLVSVGNTPCFTSSIPLSSQMITDAIAKELKISFEEAEAMKIKYGLGSIAVKSPLFKAALPILENFSVEIDRSINFYLSNLAFSPTIDNIVLCGGGSNMRGLLPFLAKRLNQPVEFGNPWVNVKLGKNLPPIDRNHSVQYSTAIGLALRGLDEYADLT